ncbi:hypothetical protein GOV07_02890 [Candidatus Woesearchaeota archaeon]|nr:hypothetical protein [Candidatus Woesearchaeota archaeon]
MDILDTLADERKSLRHKEVNADQAVIVNLEFDPESIYPYIGHELHNDVLNLINRDKTRFLQEHNAHIVPFGIIHEDPMTIISADMYYNSESKTLGGWLLEYCLDTGEVSTDFSLRRALYTSPTSVETIDMIEDVEDDGIAHLLVGISHRVVSRSTPLRMSKVRETLFEYFRQLDPFLAMAMQPEKAYLVVPEVRN